MLGALGATTRSTTTQAGAIAAGGGRRGSAWKNGYGRGLEDQADRVGLRYAYEAGYDISKGPRL